MKFKIWTAGILAFLYLVNAGMITGYKETPNGIVPAYLIFALPWLACLLESWILVWLTDGLLCKIQSWTRDDRFGVLYNIIYLVIMTFSILILRVLVGPELKEAVTIWGIIGYFIGVTMGAIWFFASKAKSKTQETQTGTRKPFAYKNDEDDIESSIYH